MSADGVHRDVSDALPFIAVISSAPAPIPSNIALAGWCPAPWIAQAIRTDGAFHVCCKMDDRGLVRDELGQRLSVSGQSLDEAWNARTLRDLRLSMLGGEWSPLCHECQCEENSGLVSQRMRYIQNSHEILSPEETKLNTSAQGVVGGTLSKPAHFELHLGNVCNLKCRMCGPARSTAWESEYTILKGMHVDVPLTLAPRRNESFTMGRAPASTFSWHRQNDLWKQLEARSGSIRQIYFGGGEPLLARGHFGFLCSLIDTGHAGHVKLVYTSNLTTLPAAALELWRHFRAVVVCASIDGVGAKANYIRHPSLWFDVSKNFSRLLAAGAPIHVVTTPTIMAYNILYLPELIEWDLCARANNRTIHQHCLIDPHPLHRPDYLSVQVLPPRAKLSIHKHLESEAEKLIGTARAILPGTMHAEAEHRIAGILRQFADLMGSADRSELLPQFWQYTHRLDVLRNERFAETFPELESLMCDSRCGPALATRGD